MALGRFEKSDFTEGDLEQLRAKWYSLLPNRKRAEETVPHQPFRLHALAQSLRLMGDPDADVIDNNPGSNYVEGVHIGHINPLGTDATGLQTKGEDSEV